VTARARPPYDVGQAVEFRPVSCRDTTSVAWRTGEYVGPGGVGARGWHRVKIDSFGTIELLPQRRIRACAPVVVKELNTISLEDWTPGQPAERWCAVRVVERYAWDGRVRLRVEVLEGPERGRVVSGLSESNLRDRPPMDARLARSPGVNDAAE
jgi:hypothetical protein